MDLERLEHQPGPWPGPALICDTWKQQWLKEAPALPCIDITFYSNAKHIFTSEPIIQWVWRWSRTLLLKDNFIQGNSPIFPMQNHSCIWAGFHVISGSRTALWMYVFLSEGQFRWIYSTNKQMRRWGCWQGAVTSCPAALLVSTILPPCLTLYWRDGDELQGLV